MTEDIVVIGAGASGMFAAINIAKSGKKVLLIEALDRPGKKILQTGNGRCNLTNLYYNKKMYNCDNKDFVDGIIKQFPVEKTVEEFEKMGIICKKNVINTVEKDMARYTGVYPNSGQASTVGDTLISYCGINGIRILSNTIVTKIKKENDVFQIYVKNKDDESIITSLKLLISVGTKAGIKESHTYGIEKSVVDMGHKLNKFLPALCSLYSDKTKKSFFKKVNGVRSEVSATLYVDNEVINTSKGEIQLCDYGLSGIVIFQLSSLASKALYLGKTVEINVDFLPDFSGKELVNVIYRQQNYEKKSLLDIVSGVLNKKLANELINEYSLKNHNIKGFSKKLSKEELMDVINFIKSFKVTITDTNDYLHGQICTGGVDVSEINAWTLESKKVKNLYFAGEFIDVDGLCGGYNLQWAWSSGYVAGRNMAND